MATTCSSTKTEKGSVQGSVANGSSREFTSPPPTNKKQNRLEADALRQWRLESYLTSQGDMPLYIRYTSWHMAMDNKRPSSSDATTKQLSQFGLGEVHVQIIVDGNETLSFVEQSQGPGEQNGDAPGMQEASMEQNEGKTADRVREEVLAQYYTAFKLRWHTN